MWMPRKAAARRRNEPPRKGRKAYDTYHHEHRVYPGPAEFPKKYSGEGAIFSAVGLVGVPENAKELVLICDDPDAPTPEPWVHWVLYKIPADTKDVAEAIPRQPRLKEPAGAVEGKTRGRRETPSAIAARCRRPNMGCITITSSLRLDRPLDQPPGLSKNALSENIRRHVWRKAC